MAAGTAPVASAHGAFPELITQGSDGALFPPTDVDALVEILADIENSPRRWDQYGQRGLQTYRSRFTPDASISRLLEIYRFAIEHPLEPAARSEDAAADSGRLPSGTVPT
jgi:glycosyltransferase involved in cell wall biosynthesis